MIGYTTYDYSPNGPILQMQNYNIDKTSIDRIIYTYDDQERLLSQKYEIKYIQDNYTILYKYNLDNTITATRKGNNPETKTYYLNSEGLIYKEVSESGQYEVSFNGPNPVTATNGLYTSTFEYNTIYNPDLLNNKNKEDNYMLNDILRANNLSENVTSTANQYLIKQSINSQLQKINIYNYTFNENGLPQTRMDYHNDVLIKEVYYIYE